MKKKPFVKVLSLALAAITLFVLCACGTAASSPAAGPVSDAAPTEASAASNGVLDEIKASGELHITLSPDFAPMEFIDSSKDGQEQYVGFDVTLAKYIADYIGVDLVIEPMSFDACQTAVYTGSVPMSISGYSWTEERGENYEISDYYYAGDNETEQVILIKKTDADKYTSAEDFSGVDVGAQNASLQMNLLTSQLPDANPITIGDLGVGVLELQNGSIEALAVAKGNAEMILDSNPDLMICSWEFEVAAEYEANVILITKGETALLNVVNEALAKAYADGLYGTWYEDAVALAKTENAAEVSVED
jgi:polar amino acid transport system substrate-binding protein